MKYKICAMRAHRVLYNRMYYVYMRIISYSKYLWPRYGIPTLLINRAVGECGDLRQSGRVYESDRVRTSNVYNILCIRTPVNNNNYYHYSIIRSPRYAATK